MENIISSASNFFNGSNTVMSSRKPTKNMAVVPNIMYCNDGELVMFKKRSEDNINPIKIPIPPKLGMFPLWDVRSLGESTNPFILDTLIITGKKYAVNTKAHKNANKISRTI
jgi:hypothetical protein